MMKVLLSLFALLAATPAQAVDDPTRMIPTVSAGQVQSWPAMDGGAAGPMTVWIWTPPGYGKTPGKRYPVLYMHDGQNLFDKSLTKFNQEWGMDETIPRMAAQGDLRDWIVVGVQSPRSRYHALFPQKIFPLLTPAFQKRAMTIDSGDPPSALSGEAYLKFLTGIVKPRVDRQYRTLRGSQDTAVMGSSMGGLMAFYAMAEYPQIFGQAAAVSMHVALGSPTEKGADHQALAGEVAEAFRRYLATSRMRPGVNRLYIDHGTGTLDGSYGPYSSALLPVLAAAGWRGPSFMFRTYAGTEHNETAWAQRVDIPLAFLDRADP
ncbi:alpha/beta hydrolase-fold protein [Sphingomonas sp. LY29]|uniref:alpha/beta hydrolase n=1 Tax=Sphingomonas sp. LY29 TaxID=3095341 RepID=UPI002D795180|nr:alpha/beta hydrolase-fold protein [Sphingomonas sp. LY29]WRP24732.1 alpha/beta hydrolase-fold protein [Sphingomonas sp. LY29]